MPHGYHGRYLRIDLDSRITQSIAIEPETLRRFIGGSGLGTRLLIDETPDGTDPLGPEAPLLFVFSPLVGSPLTTSAKFAILAKSPLTHRINDSLSSSHFAISGKKTGYDALCITGQAGEPTYLTITPQEVTFHSAAELQGLSSEETARRIRAAHGNGFRIAAIGPAGERLVRYATISNEGRHAGRGGLGAVMGAKLLKAVAVAGDRQVAFADPERLIALSRDLSRRSFGEATAKYRELGTVGNLLVFNRLGTLPTRNFQETTFAQADNLTLDPAQDSRIRNSCAACTIGCEHLFHSQDSSRPAVRMEYENLFALGPLCGIGNRETVLAASAFCDEAGIDTISAGVTAAFAMECAERGLINEPELRFGNGEALLRMLRQIASREGLGDLLANGVRAAAAVIGQGSEDFALHVKGLEIPGYDPRALQTMALGFAVGTRGADHNRSGAYQVDFSDRVDRLRPGPESVDLAVATENEAAIMDSLILCKFLRGVLQDRFSEMANMLRVVTGWDIDADELQTAAVRIVTSKKLYNIRQGWTPAEDRLPQRFLRDAIPGGMSHGAIVSEADIRERIRLYNLRRGWTEDGYPRDDESGFNAAEMTALP